MIINKAYAGNQLVYRAYFNGMLIWDYSTYAAGTLSSDVSGSAFPVAEDPVAIQMHTEATIDGQGAPRVWELANVHAHTEATIEAFGSPHAAEAVHGSGVASATIQASGAASTYGQAFAVGHAEAELTTMAAPRAVGIEYGAGTAEGELAAFMCPTVAEFTQLILTAGATIEGSATPQTQEPERIVANAAAELTAVGCPVAVPVHNVIIMGDGKILYVASVIDGYDCPDPVVDGIVEKPTKAATAQYTYAHSGWTRKEGGTADSSALKNITEDTVIYAAFTATVRKYTITYYDDDGVTFLTTQTLTYGSMPSYVPKKTDYAFDDWYPEVTPVTGDTSYYARWVEKIGFATSDWATIAELAETGKASRHFALGDQKTFTWGNYTYTAQIVGFGIDPLADGSGYAGITLVTTKLWHATVQHHNQSSYITKYDWDVCSLRTYCNETVYNGIQSDLRSVIKQVTKYTGGSKSDVATADYCWALSKREVGGDTSYEAKSTHYSSMFNSDADRKRKTISGTSATYWHLRSNPNTANMAYYVTNQGEVRTTYHTNYYPFLFGFCI